ncbi:hypothetical protein C8F04DRAFT_1276779 [Mycena alexandri]|uniref:Integrase core domain-containing protein n=1 Tax=Mycena alexandri TaxID=1745969 RepID=A0AAD6S217_9AGAR|nr:hypothetical protein C8F04DRAFT_1276779 [Mycena alexandri]
MPDPYPLVNLRTAYQIPKHNVVRTLYTQCGAPIRLNHQVTEVLQFSAALQFHWAIILPAELATVEQALADMVLALNAAHHESSDQLTTPTLVVTSQTSTGGQPRVNIDPEILVEALLSRSGPDRSTAPAMSPISDADLNSLLTSILETPNFGQQMLSSQLKSQGHRISRLICYKIVIHCFIDSKSHLITGICAGNNNWAETVLNIFKEVVAEYDLPS